jgi:hypothetical protein
MEYSGQYQSTGISPKAHLGNFRVVKKHLPSTIIETVAFQRYLFANRNTHLVDMISQAASSATKKKTQERTSPTS